ncbi:MAG: zinc-binding dehydrogenase, partial [Candidatus Ratteibacteria bacterium]|nr:zinc-binding dehydrogenase [Candidatus Ratteibacteria bacterium]
EDVKIPEINDTEVLAKVEIALTCGTDAKVYQIGGHPKMLCVPSGFGHEWSGVIKKVGKKIKNFKEGDRVTAANSAPCFKCYYCKTGKFSLCENLTFMNGAYAEYIKIPGPIVKTNLFKIPPKITFEEAAFLEPLACVMHGIGEIGVKKNEEAVIIGTGPIGLLFLLLLKNIGAKVTAVEKNRKRLEMAKKLGCDNTILVKDKKSVINKVKNFSYKGKGMDVAIEATGIPKVWEDSVKMVKGGGRVLLFGGCKPGKKVVVDTDFIHYSEIAIKGVFHHTPYHVKKAYDLIAKKKLNLKPLITDKLPLSGINTALDRIIKGKDIKIAVIP